MLDRTAIYMPLSWPRKVCKSGEGRQDLEAKLHSSEGRMRYLIEFSGSEDRLCLAKFGRRCSTHDWLCPILVIQQTAIF